MPERLVRSVARPASVDAEQPPVISVRRDGRDDEAAAAAAPARHAKPGVAAAGAADALVEGLLHRDRHDDAPDVETTASEQ